jgi:hypothetical protein
MPPLLLLTIALLAESPVWECITAEGTTVCGYDCHEDAGRARCATTPAGVCLAARGNVTCFDPPVWLASVYRPLPRPECKISSGNVACGYNCIVAQGITSCAKTPIGVCISRNGATTCFDPPVAAFAVLRARVPAPDCEDDGSVPGCGYFCAHDSGRVICATTPFGNCIAREGQLLCFDPPAAALCALGETVEHPRCVYDLGQVACGYDCKSASGKLACARTPYGSCNNSGPTGVVCFDPPQPMDDSSCLKLLGAAATQ